MATEKQIAANRRNAARSTGPRTVCGKARSRMNAFRHGFAATFGHQSGTLETGLDVEALADRIACLEAERCKLIMAIETRLWDGNGQGIDDLVRQLSAFERYSERSASALRKKR